MKSLNDRLLELNLDKQFDHLPKDVVFCKNCVVSNQRPRTHFNAEGICSACEWSFEKDNVVDWTERERELGELLGRHRKSDGSFDCIVPGSGGKDSAFVAHQLKHRWGMNPLCITWAPFEYTTIGWRNFQKFVAKGYPVQAVFPDGQLHRKLSKLAFILKGDAWEPFAFGQKTLAFHMANQFNIKLIFYGENGELEYGGTTKYKNQAKEAPDDWDDRYYKGSSIDHLLNVGLEHGVLDKSDTSKDKVGWYKFPSKETIMGKGLEMHWYSYYQKWIPQENFYYAATHTDFETNDFGRSEGTYTKYASLDDRLDGFHFYLAYMKFGLGRASRDAQQDIRRNHITREEGAALVRRYDGEFPKRHYQFFLDYLQIDEDFFWVVMDKYRHLSNAWRKLPNGKWEMPYLP